MHSPIFGGEFVIDIWWTILRWTLLRYELLVYLKEWMPDELQLRKEKKGKDAPGKKERVGLEKEFIIHSG